MGIGIGIEIDLWFSIVASDGIDILGRRRIPLLQTRALKVYKGNILKFIELVNIERKGIPYGFIDNNPPDFSTLQKGNLIGKLTTIDANENEIVKWLQIKNVIQEKTIDGILSKEYLRFEIPLGDNENTLLIKKMEIGYSILPMDLEITDDTENNKKIINVKYEGNLDTFSDTIKNSFTPMIEIDFANFRSDNIQLIGNTKVLKIEVQSSGGETSMTEEPYVEMVINYSI